MTAEVCRLRISYIIYIVYHIPATCSQSCDNIQISHTMQLHVHYIICYPVYGIRNDNMYINIAWLDVRVPLQNNFSSNSLAYAYYHNRNLSEL